MDRTSFQVASKPMSSSVTARDWCLPGVLPVYGADEEVQPMEVGLFVGGREPVRRGIDWETPWPA